MHKILVDKEDEYLLKRWAWSVSPKGYVIRSVWVRKPAGGFRHTSQYLHKIIHPAPKNLVTDHINGNKLDNRRSNLRAATIAQNNQNARTRKDNKLGYKGVIWREKSKDFVVYINVNKKRIHLKTYKNIEDAVVARKTAEQKYHGSFAYQGG